MTSGGSEDKKEAQVSTSDAKVESAEEVGLAETALSVRHLERSAEPEGTKGSGTRPEGRTQRDPEEKRPGRVGSSSDPLIGTVLLDRYRITRCIGAGGMGSVYAGEQLAVSREVALKILRADLLSNEYIRQRFKREAEIIGRLRHPNTIQLIDYGETPDGVAVMVMELLHGQPLNERLRDEGPMDLVEALTVAEQVARSLAEAHEQGLVHRDLKPANIFMVDHGGAQFAKVLDFGIARLLDEEATRLTTTGQVFGTPRYMSPEQAVSTAEVDARSDVYSLGLILYEALVGQTPFVAHTSLQYLTAHTTQTPPKLRERYPAAPEELDLLIDSCLQKSAENRPQTANLLADILVAIRRSVELGRMASSDLGDDRSLTNMPRTKSWPSYSPVVERVSESDDLEPSSSPSSTFLPFATGRKMPILTGAVAVLLAITIGLAVWKQKQRAMVEVRGLDAGVQQVMDGGDEKALALGGQKTQEPDVVVEPKREPADAGVRKPRPKPRKPTVKPRNRKPTKNKQDTVGSSAVTGPRNMILNIEDDGPDVAKLARKCRGSVLRGLARFETADCPRDCAVLIDEQCGGRTPAEGRAVSPGPRRVVIVCRGHVVHEANLRFKADEESLVSCK